MWAPAGLFTHPVGVATLWGRRAVSYFDEHTLVLVLVVLAVALVIVAIESRRA